MVCEFSSHGSYVLLAFRLRSQLLENEVAGFLTRHLVEDTITRHQQEYVRLEVDFEEPYVRLTGHVVDCLHFHFHVVLDFELEVSKRACDHQSAKDASLLYESTERLDPPDLALSGGLVVERHINRPSFTTNDSPTVTNIYTVKHISKKDACRNDGTAFH